MNYLKKLIGVRPMDNHACPSCFDATRSRGRRYSYVTGAWQKFRCRECGCRWRVDRYDDDANGNAVWRYTEIPLAEEEAASV